MDSTAPAPEQRWDDLCARCGHVRRYHYDNGECHQRFEARGTTVGRCGRCDAFVER